MAAGSKRRVLACYFSMWYCYMFPLSQCRGEWDLGLHTFMVLEKRMQVLVKSIAQCRLLIKTTCLAAKLVEGRHCTAAFCVQTLDKCTDLGLTVLKIWTSGTYTKFVRENRILSLSTESASRSHAWPQVSRYSDHIRITTDKLVRFQKNELDEMPCKLNSTENLRSFEKYSTSP